MADTHIKINAVTPRVQYTGNGVTTTFPYEFPIFDETDMVVYVGDDIIESGYSVSGAGETDGGNVTFDAAPDDGAKITLLRNVPIERLTDFQEGGTFRPKNLNDEFDRQTAFIQQVQEQLDRAVMTGPTSELQPEVVLEQIERVYPSIDKIEAVADDLTNVDTVATNISDVNTCATNIEAVLDAPTQATNAANSAAAAAASAASLDATKIAYKDKQNTFTETNTLAPFIVSAASSTEGGEISLLGATGGNIEKVFIDQYSNRLRLGGNVTGQTTKIPFEVDVQNDECYASASNSVHSVLTTESISLSADAGGFKLGNGMIINYGRIYNSNVSTSVSFTIPYTSGYGLSVTPGINTYYENYSAGIADETLTTFTLVKYPNDSLFEARWIAIGY